MEKIERVIFDFDNTLIMWKNEYITILRNMMIKHGVECNCDSLNDAIGESANYINRGMTIDNAIKQAREFCGVEITEEFVNEWFQELGIKSVDIEDDIIDTLAYLHSKYELVILSNFNGSAQRARAQHAGISEYFLAIYGSDTTKMKPHPDAFYKALGPYLPHQAVMIGDNYKEDIEGARRIGMRTILIDRKGNHENCEDEVVIHRVKELKKIL